MSKSKSQKSKQIERKVHYIDARGEILGRLAAKIAILLMGKHKPSYRPNLDMGDVVVVKNVDKIKVTGKKMEKKVYYWHTGYLGGLKSIKLKDLFKKDPRLVLKKAVLGMLPKNKLRAKRIKRLKFE